MSFESEPVEPLIIIDGRPIYPGDPVVVVNVYTDEEADTITDPHLLPATLLGEQIAVDDDGEVLFDGEPVPQISVLLPDGSSKLLWGYECDWTHPESYADAMAWFACREAALYN